MINLFDHNFDVDAKQSVHRDASAAATATADLKEQLEAARKEGFDAGHDLGQKEAKSEFDASASDRFEQERQMIQKQMAELIAQDTQQQKETERDIVELFLGIAERLVPELINNYGPALATDRIKHVVQQARTDPALTIRACSDVISALENESPSWLTVASLNVEINLVTDLQMQRGVAQVQWKGGRLEYDIEKASINVLQALAQAAKEYNEAT